MQDDLEKAKILLEEVEGVIRQDNIFIAILSATVFFLSLIAFGFMAKAGLILKFVFGSILIVAIWMLLHITLLASKLREYQEALRYEIQFREINENEC